FEESELGPKAESIEEANCKNSKVDKVDILINNIGPKADDCFSYHDDLQPGKNNKIEIACVNIKEKAKEVKGTDVNVNLSPDEDIKVNVTELNKELLYESLK
ncbi:unnamed protein product, partial [Rotaria magnacalcarata]